MRLTRGTTALAAALLMGVSGAALAQESEPLDIVFTVHSGASNTFWQAVQKGYEDACGKIGATCQMVYVQTDGSIQEQVANMEAALSRSPDALVTSIVDNTAFDDVIQRARDAGVTVIASNVDDLEGAAGNARQAFVGQGFIPAGYSLAEAQSANFPAEGPLHVLVGVSGPGQNWSEQRAQGITNFLDEYIAANPDREITYEKIDSGLDLSVTGQRVAAYVQTKPTTAYFDVGYWAAGAAVSLRDLGKQPGEVLLACFDLVPVVMDEMKSGYIQLTIDQQPFLQGYVPIHQLHNLNRYRLGAYDANTGKALVTPDQVDALIELSQQGVR